MQDAAAHCVQKIVMLKNVATHPPVIRFWISGSPVLACILRIFEAQLRQHLELSLTTPGHSNHLTSYIISILNHIISYYGTIFGYIWQIDDGLLSWPLRPFPCKLHGNLRDLKAILAQSSASAPRPQRNLTGKNTA